MLSSPLCSSPEPLGKRGVEVLRCSCCSLPGILGQAGRETRRGGKERRHRPTPRRLCLWFLSPHPLPSPLHCWPEVKNQPDLKPHPCSPLVLDVVPRRAPCAVGMRWELLGCTHPFLAWHRGQGCQNCLLCPLSTGYKHGLLRNQRGTWHGQDSSGLFYSGSIMGHHELARGHHQVPSVRKPFPRATPQQAAGCFTAPPPLLSLLGADIGHKKKYLGWGWSSEGRTWRQGVSKGSVWGCQSQELRWHRLPGSGGSWPQEVPGLWKGPHKTPWWGWG